jgi:hypothetical protein
LNCLKDYADAGGARTGVAERATGAGATRPRPARKFESCDVDGELTATGTAACHDDERLTDFSENSDAARELTMTSRASDVRKFAQKIC